MVQCVGMWWSAGTASAKALVIMASFIQVGQGSFLNAQKKVSKGAEVGDMTAPCMDAAWFVGFVKNH